MTSQNYNGEALNNIIITGRVRVMKKKFRSNYYYVGIPIDYHNTFTPGSFVEVKLLSSANNKLTKQKPIIDLEEESNNNFTIEEKEEKFSEEAIEKNKVNLTLD